MLDEARAEIGEPAEHLDLNDHAIDEWLADQHAHALNEVAGRRPAALEAWQRLHEIWPGAIALLSVDPAARAEAQDLCAVRRAHRGVHEAAGWLRAMLTVLDDEPYVAIEPATRTGDRRPHERHRRELPAQHRCSWTMFPAPTSRASPRRHSPVARGDGPQQIDETVTGVWNMYTYEALQPGGELPDATDRAQPTPGSGTRACPPTSPCSMATA